MHKKTQWPCSTWFNIALFLVVYYFCLIVKRAYEECIYCWEAGQLFFTGILGCSIKGTMALVFAEWQKSHQYQGLDCRRRFCYVAIMNSNIANGTVTWDMVIGKLIGFPFAQQSYIHTVHIQLPSYNIDTLTQQITTWKYLHVWSMHGW